MAIPLTATDLRTMLARGSARVVGEALPATPAPSVLHEARRQSPSAPFRSRTEQHYAALLDVWLHDGVLVRWRYEALRLRLAPATTLTVDFLLTFPQGWGDGRLQFHEVKGATWFREDGWQKLKQAAALYPEFRFYRVQWLKGEWHYQEVPTV